jgi:hypothetical protein
MNNQIHIIKGQKEQGYNTAENSYYGPINSRYPVIKVHKHRQNAWGTNPAPAAVTVTQEALERAQREAERLITLTPQQVREIISLRYRGPKMIKGGAVKFLNYWSEKLGNLTMTKQDWSYALCNVALYGQGRFRTTYLEVEWKHIDVLDAICGL